MSSVALSSYDVATQLPVESVEEHAPLKLPSVLPAPHFHQEALSGTPHPCDRGAGPSECSKISDEPDEPATMGGSRSYVGGRLLHHCQCRSSQGIL